MNNICHILFHKGLPAIMQIRMTYNMVWGIEDAERLYLDGQRP